MDSPDKNTPNDQAAPRNRSIANHLFWVSGSTIGGAILTRCALLIVGFSPVGVVAGTAAAAWQSTIGNVAAGSLFAGLQSVSMTGVAAGVGAVVAGVGAVRVRGLRDKGRVRTLTKERVRGG